MTMMIRPVLKSSLYQTSAYPHTPLQVMIPDPLSRLETLPRPLRFVTLISAVRGVILNQLQVEYGHTVKFWIDYNQRGNQTTDATTLMLEAEEAFETAVELLNDFADYLSIYSDLDHLQVQLIRYDPSDLGFLVRISNGGTDLSD